MRFCSGTNHPAGAALHSKKLPDWHFYLTFSRHACGMAVFVNLPHHLSHTKIFLSELFLHMSGYVRYYLPLILLNTPLKANRIGILKKDAFVIGIEGQIYKEYKYKHRPGDQKSSLHRHIPLCRPFYKHIVTPIPKSRNGENGISLSRRIFFATSKTTATADSTTRPRIIIKKQR